MAITDLYSDVSLNVSLFQDMVFSLPLFHSDRLSLFKNDIVYITPGQTFFGIAKYTLFILLSTLLNKELIIHVHGNFLGKQYDELKGFKKKFFYYLISKFTKGIVLSESLKNNLSPFLDTSKIFIVENFAEDFLFKDLKKDINRNLQIVYLSNLMEEKGILYLLDALAVLEERNIIYKAKIAGNIDESLKEKIVTKINKLENTSYLGIVYKKEKKELLEWSYIFVLPTFYKMEGQPISILEALATKNVVIATNHAGIKDVITSNVNGYLVKPKSVESIVEPLLFLKENRDKIKEIAELNFEYFINNFTVQKFKNKIIKIINASTRVK